VLEMVTGVTNVMFRWKLEI